jgi:hypothetical protein
MPFCVQRPKLSDGIHETPRLELKRDGRVHSSTWLGHWYLALKQSLTGHRILDTSNLRCEKEINRVLTRWTGRNIRGDMIVSVSLIASPANVKNLIAMPIEKMDDRPVAAALLKDA